MPSCVALLRQEFHMSQLTNSQDFVRRQAFSGEAPITAPIRIEGAIDGILSAEQLENDLIIVATAPEHWHRGEDIIFAIDWEERNNDLMIFIPGRWEAGLQVVAVLKAEIAGRFADQHVRLGLIADVNTTNPRISETTLFDFAVQTPRVRIAGAVGGWQGLIPASVALEGADLLLRLGSDRQAGEIVSLYGTGSAVGSSWVEHIEIKEADLLTGLRVYLSPQILMQPSRLGW
jgi:hypothetical protein